MPVLLLQEDHCVLSLLEALRRHRDAVYFRPLRRLGAVLEILP